MILTDPLAKTVAIPVFFKDGNFINVLTDEKLSGIKQDARGEFVIETHKIFDHDLLALLSDETETELFPRGEILRVEVSDKEIPDNFSQYAIPTTNFSVGGRGRFVEVELKTPLKMMFRGTKQPSLFDCGCYIPALDKAAISLNHAYTLISTDFEPYRRSHTGNVFEKIFFRSNLENRTQGQWIKLDNLRLAKNQQYFEKLRAAYNLNRGKSRERAENKK